MKFMVLAACCIFFLTSCGAIQDVEYLRYQFDNGANPEKVKQALTTLSNKGYQEADWALADINDQSESLADLKKACDFYKGHPSDTSASLYAKCLARMSYHDTSYRDSAHQLLLERYKHDQGIATELAKFYAFYADFYKPEKIDHLITEMQHDPENIDSLLNIMLLSRHPSLYSQYIKDTCSKTNLDEKTISQCTQLELKIAKIENNEAEISKITGKLEEKYSNSGKDEFSPSEEDTLYRCANVLLSQDIGSKHLLEGLKIAELGQGKSDRLFLLSARYEYKRKYLMPTETLLKGLVKLAENHNEEAMRLLGEMYAEGYRVPDNSLTAEKYLVPLSSSPKAALALGRLYLSGKLGAEQLQKGIDTLLFAARNGELQGYTDLAHAFNGHPGIKANDEYAWVFAEIASACAPPSETPSKLQILTTQLEDKITDLDQSKHLLQNECAHIHAAVSSPCETIAELPKK